MKKTLTKQIFVIVALLLTSNHLLAQAQNFGWAKLMGSPNIDRAETVAVDPITGHILVTGSFTSTVDFDPGPGVFNMTAPGTASEDQIFVCKLNAAGGFIWAVQMGGTDDDAAFGIDIEAVTKNVYVTGRFNATADFDPGPGVFNLVATGSTPDLFVAKLDSSGNFIWAKKLGGNNGHSFGVKLDGGGNVYTAGMFKNTADMDPGPLVFNLISFGFEDIFICKLNSNGDFVWAKNMGGPSRDIAYALDVDNAGNVYTTGTFSGTADFDPGPGTASFTWSGGNGDLFVSKLDAAGNYVWAFPISSAYNDEARAIKINSAGEVIIGGSFGLTVDLDPGPGTVNVTSVGQADIVILKVDAAGNFIWGKTLGGKSSEACRAVSIDNSDNIYSTGTFVDTADFDPSGSTYNLISNGIFEAYILKLNSNGDFIWAGSIGGPESDVGYGITADASQNIYTVGTTRNSADFDPGPLVYTLVSNGAEDLFIQKMTPANVGFDDLGEDIRIDLFPNPASDKIFIRNISPNSIIRITDLLGKTILTTKVSGEITTIDTSNLQSGMYFTIVQSTSNSTSHNLKGVKFIVQ